MEAFYPAINSALAHLPTNIDFAILLSRDGCEELVPPQKGSTEVYGRNVLRNVQSAGGHDNTSALTRAWELAAQTNTGTIVWVHGPQPVALDSVEELRQRCERSSQPPTLIEVQTVPGPNRVLERLDGLSSVHSLVRMGELGDDLTHLFNSWTNKADRLDALRERLSSTTPDAHPEGAETSMHLARLWAADEVARLCAARKRPEATQVATRYRLVTPVSGGVVLETQAQYERAGLQPSPAEKVPVVPEPSTAALVVLGLICAAVRYRRRASPR
jgi:hypothetical protein